MKAYRIYFRCYLGTTEKAPSHICWQVVEAYDKEHARTKFDKWDEDFTLEELDLSNNMISDFGCKHIAAILMKTKLKKVNLSGNIMIDKDGFIINFSSIPNIPQRGHKYFASFIGSNTYWVRTDMVKAFRGKDDCLVKAGSWNINVGEEKLNNFMHLAGV